MPSGSLSKDVFKRRTSTGSGRFANLRRDFDQFLDQIVSMIEKIFRNTNLVFSRHLRREKDSLPVDVRHLTCCFPRILYKETSLCNRVLKCDAIKMKFLKLWDLSVYILKGQCPRGLFAKNEHFGANCLWDRSPVMLRRLHTHPFKLLLGRPKKKLEGFVWSFLSITG